MINVEERNATPVADTQEWQEIVANRNTSKEAFAKYLREKRRRDHAAKANLTQIQNPDNEG